jgi:predicted amidohydrolase
MKNTSKSVRAAVVQAAPVIMDREATIGKALIPIIETILSGSRGN